MTPEIQEIIREEIRNSVGTEAVEEFNPTEKVIVIKPDISDPENLRKLEDAVYPIGWRVEQM